MKEETKKQVASFGVGGVSGFALGWLLHRPGKATASNVQLSNLTFTPDITNVTGTISVDATNNGTAPANVYIYINTGIVGWSKTITLQPGEKQTVTQTIPIISLVTAFGDNPFVISAGVNDIIVTPIIGYG